MTDKSDTSTDLTLYDVGGVTVPVMSTEDAATRIMERVVASQSWQEALNAAESSDADSIDGRPFMLRNVEFYPSNFDEGPGVYAIMHVDFADDGTHSVVTCGGQNVIAQLVVCAKYGMPDIPITLKRNERPTSNGFFPLWLHAA